MANSRSPQCIRALAFACAAGLTCFTVAADTLADEVDQCIKSSDQGQVLRDRGRLLDAREQFVGCAREQCPRPIRSDCSTWLAEVEARIPTLIFRVRDEQGRDLAGVRMSMDGRLLPEGSDGRAVSVDPGEHALRFERAGASAIEIVIVARETEKNRIVDVAWKPAATVAKPAESEPKGPSREPIPAGFWILSGVGLAGVASFSYFGWTAKHDVDDMRATCAPTCEDGRVADARRDATIANVSLGVGVIALGTATYLLLSRGEENPTTEAWRGAGALAVSMIPSQRGASVAIASSF